MAARRTRSSRPPARKKTARRARPGRRWRIVAWTVATLAFLLGFAAATWIVRLDRVVVARFEGRRFRVPSKVLSAPTILYPGLDLERIDLRAGLERMGYREQSSGPLGVGTYRWSPRRVRAHVRAFDHPTRAEPAREVEMWVRKGVLEEIRDLATGREMGALLLEPESVGAYYGPDREQRELVRLRDVPPHLVDAVLAVEDRRFLDHHGVDARRILGALWANVQAGSVRQGGSTLTQQLVKNFFLTPDRTLSRKIQEAAMALLVEARYDKGEILESYLNEIYLGQRGSTAVHGVGEAARLYFGKRAAHLSVGESALLAAIIQSPNRLSPFRDADQALGRRDLVLRLMEEQGRLDATTYAAARVEPLRLAAPATEQRHARWFLDLLRRQLPEAYDKELLSAEGLRIYSTLDMRFQRAAARALSDGLLRIERRHPHLAELPDGRRLEGCIVALRPQTGEILALVGGRDYGRSQFYRSSHARRQAGSVFKPFVYLAALERPGPGGASGDPAITLASFLDDSPLDIPTRDGVWSPQNIDREFRGRVSVRESIERSLNVPVARLAQTVGIERVVDVAARLGIESKLPAVPSLALGTADVSPLELARAYATIANGGTRPSPHSFEDVVTHDARRLERRRLGLDRVLDPGSAYLGTSLLEGVVERGTAARVRSMGLMGPIAGKTGTSNDEHDLWFAGFTPELVAVVWIGFDEPRSIGVSSSSSALPIWASFVRESLGSEVRGAFLPPRGIERLEVEPLTGALALPGCPSRRPEYFLEDTRPRATCPEGARTSGAGEVVRDVVDWFRELF